MSFEKVKELRDSLKNQKTGNVAYFEDDTKSMFRILPLKGSDEQPFKDAWVHYRSSNIVPKTVLSPKSFDKVDPLETFVDRELNKGRVEPKKFAKLMSMKPTQIFLAPIIVRGKEAEGVKFLSLSENQFSDFVDMVYNTFHPKKPPALWDIENGFDIIVDVKSKEKSATDFRSVKYTVARDSSPLQNEAIDDEQLEQILNDQPDWSDAYAKATADELSEYLRSSQVDGEEEELDDDLAEYASEEDLLDDDDEDIEDSDVVAGAMDKFKKKMDSKESDESEDLVEEMEENPF